MTVNQGQENAILNRALSPVPTPHLTGAELNADIQLGDRVFNTIDANNVAWFITGIKGWLDTPEPDFPDVSRGIQGDGDYDVDGRYAARIISLEGSILVPNRTYVPAAHQELVRTVDLVRKGAWLKFSENPTKAVYVRLSGAAQIETVNPRGRIDFSIGLKAADPVKYEWNSARSDGYTLANVKAANSDGSETGELSLTNNGNYPVSAIFEVTGPILSSSASIFNNARTELITFNDTLRGERTYTISAKSMTNGNVTLTLNNVSDLSVGDDITVQMFDSRPLNTTTRVAGSSLVTVRTTTTHGYSTGDIIVLSNVHPELDGIEFSATRSNSIIVTITTANTTAISNSGGEVMNITNYRYNGTFPISNVNTSANTVSYTTIFNETYANVSAFSATTVRPADVLEIDTHNREVALNGETYQQRAKLDSLIDWIKLGSGVNDIVFDDSVQSPTYVYKVSHNGAGVATAYSSVEHGFKVGDSVIVSNVRSGLSNDYNTTSKKSITSYSQSGTTVTINSTSHGFANTSTVAITGISLTIDGIYSVSNSQTNSFQVTVLGSDTIYTTTLAAQTAYARQAIRPTSYSKATHTVTVTANSHGLSSGDDVFVFGLPDDLDGLRSVVSTTTNTFTYSVYTYGTISSTNVSDASVSRRYQVTNTTPYSFSYSTVNATGTSEATNTFGVLVSVDDYYATPSSITKASNVVTVVTTREHGFFANSMVQVENVGAGYNVGTGNPVLIANVARSTNVVTVFTSTTHSLVANDIVQIYGTSVAETDVSLNGTYSVATAPNTSAFTFITNDSGTVATQAQERAFAAKKIRVGFYTKNSGSGAYGTVAGNVVYFFTKTNHGLSTGDSVYVENLASSLNGVQPRTITNVNASVFSLVTDSISLTEVKSITSATNSSSTITVNSANHGFERDDVIYVYNTHASIAGMQTITFANADSFQYVCGTTTPTMTGASSGRVGYHSPSSTIAEAYPIISVPNATTFTYRNADSPATNATNQIGTGTVYSAGEVVLSSDAKMSVYYRSGWIG
jgi:hypothetical protein